MGPQPRPAVAGRISEARHLRAFGSPRLSLPGRRIRKLRLDRTDPSVIAEKQLFEDGRRLVAFAGEVASSYQIAQRPLRLTGLVPAAAYRIELVNRDDTPRLSRGNPSLKQGASELSVTFLMQHGITLPWNNPERM